MSFLSTILIFISAGLDSGRYHPSPALNWDLCAPGIILTISGQLLFLVAQNKPFFSSTVRIQKDRGQTVCDSGMYKIVRHPAYLGLVLQSAGFPLLFGSAWCIIPATLSIFLILTRTYLEDKTLKHALNGYLEYSEKTRYRLIPYIW